MSQVQNIRFQSKVDSKSEWEKNNPKLLDKEIGYERETGRYKIGNGIKRWNDLPYAFGGDVVAGDVSVRDLQNRIDELESQLEEALNNIIAIQNELMGVSE